VSSKLSFSGTGGALTGISSGEANAVETVRAVIVDSSIKFNRIRHPYRRGVYLPFRGIFHGSKFVTQNLIMTKPTFRVGSFHYIRLFRFCQELTIILSSHLDTLNVLYQCDTCFESIL